MAWDVLPGVKLVKALLQVDLSRRIDRVRIDMALHTLREIFFYSTELIKVLEDIEEGKPVDREVAELYADAFEDVPPWMQESLEFLAHERFEDRNILRIGDMNILQLIRDGKIDTRREISRFFRSYLEGGARRRNELGAQATHVLGQIERLNANIEKLEAKLITARGMGGAAPRRPTRVRTRET